MKKFTLFLVVLFVGSVVYSQGLGVGVKGGLNFPTFDAIGGGDGIQSSDTKNASGYHLGGFLKVRAAKVGLQPEVLYSFQQIEFERTQLGQTFDVKQKFSYLTVPVMLKLFLVAGLNVQVGPQFGFAVNTKESSSALAGGTVDIKDEVKNADLSAAFGLGIELPFGLDIHGRYVLGITDMDENSGGSSEKNSVIQISLGFAFIDVGR